MAGGTTANFYANFDQFDQSLRQAEAGLKSFELSTRGIQGQLQRLTSSFDGSKIIRDAQLVTSAVAEIGGASKLTEAEQKRVNAAVTEAIAKYKALGQEAPEAMQRLARETQQVEQRTSGMRGMLQTALGTFAGFVSAQAVIGGVSTAFQYAARTAIDMNASLDRTTLQFQTLMGDAGRARDHVKSLFQFAKETPFETGPIIEASRLMQTFGGDALNTKENLTLIGDAAAATGAPINEVGMWVGRLYANLQAGRPIGEAAQRLTELAVIGPEARMALEAVAGSGKSVEEKFRVMQDALGQFTGAMQLQAATWDGVISSLSDTVNMTLAESFRGFYETARDTIGDVTKVISDAKVEEAMQGVATAIGRAFGADQRAQVRSMTDLTIALGQALLVVAEIGVRVGATLVMAWKAAGSIGANVANTFLGFLTAITELEAKMSPGNERLQREAREMRFGLEMAKAYQRELHATANAALDAALGNGQVIQSLRTLGTALDEAKTRAANAAQASAALGTATQGAAAATRSLKGELPPTTEEVKRAQKEAAELAKVTGRDLVTAMQEMATRIERAGGLANIARSKFDEINKVFKAGIIAASELGIAVPNAMVDIARATEAANQQLMATAEWLRILKQYEIPGSSSWKPPVPLPTVPGGGAPTGPVIPGGPNLPPVTVPAPPTWLDQTFEDWSSELLSIWQGFTRGISTTLADMLVGLRSWKDGVKELWQQALTSISDVIASGLNRIIDKLGSMLYNAVGNSGLGMIGGALGAFAIGKNNGPLTGALSGAAMGAVLGSVLPGIGTAIGAGIGALAGTLGGLFNSRPSESQLANTQVNEYLAQFKGDGFNQQFRDAQVDPEVARRLTLDLFNAKTREQATAAQQAIEAILSRNNALLTEQRGIHDQIKGIEQEIVSLEAERERIAQSLIPTWDQVRGIIDKYQIAEGSLGQQINQLGTTANFKTVINDMETLFRAGADVGGVLYGMREEISKLVQDSLKFGTEIPSNMQPYIQELSRAGLLVDANGEKITDLGKIKWGQPVESEADKAKKAMAELDRKLGELRTTFDDLIARLGEIVELLKTDLPRAATTPIPTVRIPYRYDQEGSTPSVDGLPRPDRADSDPYMASGGIVTRRTRAVIGEAGPEAIIPLSRAGAFFGSSPIVVTVELDGRVVAESMVEHLPRRLASRMVGV